MALADWLLDPKYKSLMGGLFGSPVAPINVTPSLFDNPDMQSAMAQYNAQNAAGAYDPNQNGAPYSGGLLGSQPGGAQQGAALGGMSPSTALPYLQAMMAFQTNPIAKTELQGKQADIEGKKLTNAGQDLINQINAIKLPEEKASSAAFLARVNGGQQPQQGQDNPQGDNGMLQQMGFPNQGGVMPPMGPPSGGVPISTKAPYNSDILPGLDPGTAAIMGRGGLASVLAKYAEPKTLGEKDQVQNFDFRTGQMGTIPNPSHQTRTLSPMDLGMPPGMVAPGTMFQLSPTGQLTKLDVSGAKSPLAAQQDVQLAGQTAASGENARLNAQTNYMLPVTDPRVRAHVQAILAGNESQRNVPEPLKNSVAMGLSSVPAGAFAPAAKQEYTALANSLAQPYTDMSSYKLTRDGAPFLQRISAAMQTPGSVSDADLLDSVVKLNNGNGAITEAQINAITGGRTTWDAMRVALNKGMTQNGGILSPNQRQQLSKVANAIFQNYQKGYQPIYEKVQSQYDQAGVPQAFRTMPDLNTIIRQGGTGQQGQPGQLPDAARAALKPGKITTFGNGQKWTIRDGQAVQVP